MSAESERRTETIPEWKREEVADIVALLEGSDSVGVVDITGIPSRQLQAMRRDLHGTAQLRVSRNTLVVRALEEVGEGFEELVEFVTGQVGLIVTDANPFSLYRRLEASKTPAPINAGEVAPNDIVIPAGDTGIDPGPFVGDLQQVGAEARIEEGSIRVLSDSTVLEAGQEVNQDLASVLAELDIEPKEVGLDLRSVYADGVNFGPDELAIDVDAYRADVGAGATAARNLALNVAHPTPGTVGDLLAIASGEARALGLAAGIESPGLADDLLATAGARGRTLATHVDGEDAGQTTDEAQPDEDRDDPDAPADDGAHDEPEDATADAAEEESAAPADDEADEADATDDDSTEDGADALGDMFGDST